MIEQVQDFIATVLRQLLTEGLPTTRPPVCPPAEVAIDVPADFPSDVGAELAEQVGALFRRRSTELGVNRVIMAQVIPRGAAVRTTVSFAGRPVAVITRRLTADDEAIEQIVDLVDRALCRHLGLLLDQPAAAWWLTSGQAGVDARILGALAYVLDCGISIGRTSPAEVAALSSATAGGPAELGEELVSRHGSNEIVIQASPETLQRTADQHPSDLPRVRGLLFDETGLQFPDVRIVPTVDGPPGVVRLRLNDVTRVLRIGPDAGWTEVVDTTREVLLSAAPWYVSIALLRDMIDELRDSLPDLMELVTGCYSDRLLAACIRELLWHGDSARNLPRILWLLLDAGDEVPPDRVSLSETPLLRRPGDSRVATADPAALMSSLRRRVTFETLAAHVTEATLRDRHRPARRGGGSTGHGRDSGRAGRSGARRADVSAAPAGAVCGRGPDHPRSPRRSLGDAGST